MADEAALHALGAKADWRTPFYGLIRLDLGQVGVSGHLGIGFGVGHGVLLC